MTPLAASDNTDGARTVTSSPPARLWGKAAIVALLALGVGVFLYVDAGEYLSLDALRAHRASLLAYTHAHYGLAVAAFILAYIVQTAFSLPGGAILTIAGGFLFGSVLGTLFVNIGATIGATLAFLAARYLLHDWVERQFGDRLNTIQAGFADNAFSYLITLRLIPAFPFFLVNLVSGLTRVSLGTYIIATAVGIIPGSFVFAFAGSQLGNISSVADIASPPVLLALTFLGLLALLPTVYRYYRGAESTNAARNSGET